MNWFNKISSLTKIAAKQRYWHGTSAKNLQSILKHGLVANLPDEKRVYPSGQPSASYDGVYMARNILDAYEAAEFAGEGKGSIPFHYYRQPDIILIEIEAETNASLIDEDYLPEFAYSFEKAKKSNPTIMEKQKTGKVHARDVLTPYQLSMLVMDATDDYLNALSYQTYWNAEKEALNEQQLSIHPNAQNAIRPIVTKIMEFYARTENASISMMNANIIQHNRELINQLIRQLRFRSKGSESLRSPNSIGFSGSTRIISIFRFQIGQKGNAFHIIKNADAVYTSPNSSDVTQVALELDSIISGESW